MTDYVKIAVAAFLIAFGWFGRGYYQDSLELAIERAADASAQITAAQIAQIKVENTTITNKTVEKIKTDIMYRECVADTTMMGLTNKARE